MKLLADRVGNYSRYEIERKFLIKTLPFELPVEYTEIKDIYLNDCSLRFRTVFNSRKEIIARKLTKKEKVPDKGPETNIITSLYLTEKDALALGSIEGQRLWKRRYELDLEGKIVLFDVFQGPLEGLILAEVEFLDHSSCRSYERYSDSWIEVTGRPEYSGGFLSSLKSLGQILETSTPIQS